MNGKIKGMHSKRSEALDTPGFVSDGSYINKHGTPQGESAMFNKMPPGMDIDDQENALINELPLKKIVGLGYPGSGWE